MTMNPFFEDIVIEMSGQGPTGKTGNSIESIVKTSTEVLTDTYTITFTWGNTSTFEVENGNGIVSITKTGTDVLTDTYTVLFSNETTTTFDVVNGRGISSIAKKSTDVLQDVYEITYNDGTTSDYTVTNGRGITSIEKSGSHDNVDIYTISYNDNTVSTFQVVNGIDGTAATIAVGSTMTGLPGTDASVTNSGTSRDAVFNFVIPRGNTGNGIASIALVGTVGLTKTYRVTYTDGEHFDYQVLDGNGIASIVLYSTSGLNKTYRVTYTNGDHFDYVVSDGNGISSITLLSQSGLVKTYRITYTNGTHFDFSVSDGNGIASIEKTATVGAVDTYTVTFTDPTAEPFSYDVTNGSDTWGAIVGDLSDQTDLQTALDNKAPVIVASASGDIVTITDGADDMPVESLSVSVEPVQDLHGYDNPWPAGGGKNLLQNTATTQTVSGVTFTVNSDGTVSVSGTATATAKLEINRVTLPEGSYIVSGGINGNCYINVAGKVNSYSSDNSFSVASGGETLTINLYVASGTTASGTFKPMIRLTTVTDDTFAPYENICPISGWTEANVMRTGVNLVDWTGPQTVTSQTILTDIYMSKKEVYTASCNITNTGSINCALKMYVYKGSKIIIQNEVGATSGQSGRFSVTIDLSSTDFDRIRFIASGSSAGYSAIYSDLQLEYGSSATPYQPYQGQQVTIPLGQTVYGATLDVGAGTLRVTSKLVTLTGTEATSVFAITTNFADRNRIAYNPYERDGKTNGTFIANLLKTGTNSTGGSGSQAWEIFGALTGPRMWIAVPKTIASVDDFKAWLASNNLQVVYELATPIVITGLTPAILRTLLGYNAIWADCGAVDVSYRADTKLFVEQTVDSAVTAVKRIMTTTTTEMVAPTNLTAGQIVIVGDDLYKATSNIASRATLTVGSNVQKVTLAEWVASLVA